MSLCWPAFRSRRSVRRPCGAAARVETARRKSRKSVKRGRGGTVPLSSSALGRFDRGRVPRDACCGRKARLLSQCRHKAPIDNFKRGRIKGNTKDGLKVCRSMLRLIGVILVTVMLALSAAATRSSEAATADDTARFLAGLRPSSSSPLAAFTNDPAWLSHARYLDSIFAREESVQLSRSANSQRNTFRITTTPCSTCSADRIFSTRPRFFRRLNVCFGRSRTAGRGARADESRPLGHLWGIA